LVWHYGHSIPEISGNDQVPTRQDFLLLVEENTYADWKKDFPNHKFEHLGVLDLNPVHDTGTNNRLIRNYYLLTLKP
ncbi:MAG TPA: hypothetical protein VK941_11045, partial [Gillisia sp.]|nr:hypothetical protein [Gillisia sp.]